MPREGRLGNYAGKYSTTEQKQRGNKVIVQQTLFAVYNKKLFVMKFINCWKNGLLLQVYTENSTTKNDRNWKRPTKSSAKIREWSKFRINPKKNTLSPGGKNQPTSVLIKNGKFTHSQKTNKQENSLECVGVHNPQVGTQNKKILAYTKIYSTV